MNDTSIAHMSLIVFAVLTTRFIGASLTIMGGLYFYAVPYDPAGCSLAGFFGFIWAFIGLLVGDAPWGWQGLLRFSRG